MGNVVANLAMNKALDDMRRFRFAAIHLLESAPQESFTGAHEDLPHLP
jgi:hypothetical protein